MILIGLCNVMNQLQNQQSIVLMRNELMGTFRISCKSIFICSITYYWVCACIVLNMYVHYTRVHMIIMKPLYYFVFLVYHNFLIEVCSFCNVCPKIHVYDLKHYHSNIITQTSSCKFCVELVPQLHGLPIVLIHVFQRVQNRLFGIFSIIIIIFVRRIVIIYG